MSDKGILGAIAICAAAFIAFVFAIQTNCANQQRMALDAMKTCVAAGGSWIENQGQNGIGGNCVGARNGAAK